MIDKGRCLEYRGFCGSVEYSAPDDLLHGTTLGELKTEFAESVEDWIQFCEDKREEEMQSQALPREMAIA